VVAGARQATEGRFWAVLGGLGKTGFFAKYPPGRAPDEKWAPKKVLIPCGISLKIAVARTGKFLIPIKYRNCYFFSVS
jgi:hypothetical protein